MNTTPVPPKRCVATALAVGFAVSVASADQVRLKVELGKPVLPADTKHTTYLKVGLTGFKLDGDVKRPPVNVAIVLDKSGSMQGEKIRQAREAAKLAIGRLTADDIVSVISYDSTVNVLVPATRVSDKSAIFQQIDRIGAGGNTALFGGVSKGAAEVRKFFDRNRVNRIFLLSDGKANVGPSSPGELGELGKSLGKEGISVTTLGLGLGYNEDLMTQLAMKSDGSHSFIEEPSQLTEIFNEDFGEALKVVAQKVEVRIECRRGVRPVRVLGRDADIAGQTVVAVMNQIYSEEEQFVLVEVEVDGAGAGQVRDIATVSLGYLNMATAVSDRLSSSVAARFTASESEVAKSVNRDVMVACVAQIAVENNIKATELRDQGRIDEARRMLLQNRDYLTLNGEALNSEFLRNYGGGQGGQALNLDEAKWNANRKQMRYEQQAISQGKFNYRAPSQAFGPMRGQIGVSGQGAAVQQQIPVLGDLPQMGRLFRNSTNRPPTTNSIPVQQRQQPVAPGKASN